MPKIDVVAVAMGIGDPMDANSQTLVVVGLVERPEATRMGVGDRCRAFVVASCFEGKQGRFSVGKIATVTVERNCDC